MKSIDRNIVHTMMVLTFRAVIGHQAAKLPKVKYSPNCSTHTV